MDWTLLRRRLLIICGGLATAIVLHSLLADTRLPEFTSRETEGFNTTILLLGSIYAVMFAFVIFVIWGQFTEVERLAGRECGFLNDLVRFSRFGNPDVYHCVRRAVTDYGRLVATAEWEALGRRERDIETENAFCRLVKTVMPAATNAAPQLMDGRLVDIARDIAECRDERIAKSLTRVPPTLIWLVRSMALALAGLVFLYPFHSALVGACCFAVVGSILFFADVVMMDTDNPFSGVCNVSPQAFAELVA